jgi:hypothetical protein
MTVSGARSLAGSYHAEALNLAGRSGAFARVDPVAGEAGGGEDGADAATDTAELAVPPRRGVG